MDKTKFFEAGMLVDSDTSPKHILWNRVEEMGLGFEQVKVDPEVILPCLDALGKTTEFAAFVNHVGAPDVIGSPAVCAWLKQAASFYQGGMFVANTCESLVAQDNKVHLEVPESVQTAIEGFAATIAASVEGHKGDALMIASADVLKSAAPLDVSELDLPENPKTKAEDTVAGEWVLVGDGAAYVNGVGQLVVKFVPEDKFTFAELLATATVAVTDSRDEGFVVKGEGVLHLNNSEDFTEQTLAQLTVSLSLGGTGATAGQVTGLWVTGTAGTEISATVALNDTSTKFSCEEGLLTPETVVIKLSQAGFEDALVTVAVEALVAAS